MGRKEQIKFSVGRVKGWKREGERGGASGCLREGESLKIVRNPVYLKATADD